MSLWSSIKNFVTKTFQRKNTAAKPEVLHTPAIAERASPEPKPQTAKDMLALKGLILERSIGKGYFGEVWIALNKDTDKYLAVKIVERKESDPKGYENEFQAVQRYRAHDMNTCCRYKVEAPINLDPLQAFAYTMPLADDVNSRFSKNGGDASGYEPMSLAAKLSRSGPLSAEECITITQNVIEGLEQLHKKRLIHRDIKPANILFFDGQAALADIGLVTTPAPDVSQRGTPGYVPHEGVGGERADIFALGKLLHEMATGNSPNQDLQFPANESKPDMRRLFKVIMLACETDVARRFINTQALKVALRKVSEKPPHIPDEQSALEWIALADQNRRNKHVSDPRELLKYKTQFKKIIGESTARIKKESSVSHLGPESFIEVTDDILNEFERRLGFQPEMAVAICNLAQEIIGGKRDSLLTIILKALRVRRLVERRREDSALKILTRGMDHVIDDQWEVNYTQFENR